MTKLQNLRTALILAPAASLIAIAPAHAQEAGNPVSTQLSGASVTGWLTSGQGIIVTALILVVGFTMFRRVFR